MPVVATVIDEEGRFVPGLEQEQFTILDNGVPQEITFFQNDVRRSQSSSCWTTARV